MVRCTLLAPLVLLSTGMSVAAQTPAPSPVGARGAEIPPTLFGGLVHQPVGAAQLRATPLGLLVEILGSTGDDGVRIELPTSATGLRAVGTFDMLGAELPSSVELIARGDVAGLGNRVLYRASAVLTADGVTARIEGAELGIASWRLRAFRDGAVVAEVGGLPVAEAEYQPAAACSMSIVNGSTGYTYATFGLAGGSGGSGPGIGFGGELSEVSLAGGPPVLAHGIVALPEGDFPQVLGRTSETYLAQGLPGMLFLNEAPQLFGLPVAPSPGVLVQSGPAAGTFELSGPDGQAPIGARFELPPSAWAELRWVAPEPIDPGVSPVALTVGSTARTTAGALVETGTLRIDELDGGEVRLAPALGSKGRGPGPGGGRARRSGGVLGDPSPGRRSAGSALAPPAVASPSSGRSGPPAASPRSGRLRSRSPSPGSARSSATSCASCPAADRSWKPWPSSACPARGAVRSCSRGPRSSRFPESRLAGPGDRSSPGPVAADWNALSRLGDRGGSSRSAARRVHLEHGLRRCSLRKPSQAAVARGVFPGAGSGDRGAGTRADGAAGLRSAPSAG